jgi:fructose-1-phosphate kinase PfkB-like protein
VIHAITLNTGFDDYFFVNDVRYGSVSDVVSFESRPSGKGINAAIVASALGVDVTSYALVGSGEQLQFDRALHDFGVESVTVPVNEPTRHNLTLASESGEFTAAHFRARGFQSDVEQEVNLLFEHLLGRVRADDVVSIHGSTPASLPSSTWRFFANKVTDLGCALFADIYGPSLTEVLELRAATLCKVNWQEAQSAVKRGGSERDLPAAVLLDRLRRSVRNFPVVTRGAEGFLTIDGEKVVSLRCDPKVSVQSVAAGDAAMGALLSEYMRGERRPIGLCKASVGCATAWVEGTPLKELRSRTQELISAVEVTAS